MLLLVQVVRCLLIEPFPESALNEQAGKMLLENYDEYARHARSVSNSFFLPDRFPIICIIYLFMMLFHCVVVIPESALNEQ
jgi:hypothetical protein